MINLKELVEENKKLKIENNKLNNKLNTELYEISTGFLYFSLIAFMLGIYFGMAFVL